MVPWEGRAKILGDGSDTSSGVVSMAELNPLMVMVARESRGFSQTAIAKRVGIEQGTWSKIENGLLEPSDELAQKMAEELDYTVELLREDLDFKQLPLSFFRKQKRVPQKVAKGIRAEINILRLQAKKMMAEAELPTLRLLHRDAGSGTEGAVDAARELRLHWHVPPGPVQNLTRLLEDNGVMVAHRDFGDERVDAISIYDPEDSLPPVVLLSPELPPDRYRFTLAHELAHVILHHHQAIPNEHVDIEAQAHAFAAEFLMPAREIRGHFSKVTLHSLANLKTYWGTSMQALLYRAKELGKVSPRNQRYLWMQMGKAGYRTQEPVAIPPERPTLFKELVEVYEEQTRQTKEQASRALGFSKVEEFESWFGERGGQAGGHLRLIAT